MAITEIASLDQVKSYLRIPSGNTNDDTLIQTVFMPAAQRVIEKELGFIVKKTIRAERHDGGKLEIYLRRLPVLYIENIEEGWGYYNWELDDQEVNTQPPTNLFAYSLDSASEGLVTRRGPGNVNYPFVAGCNNVRVDYVAGRTELPANALLVFCELAAHWYRASQLRSANQVTGIFSPQNLDTDFTRSTGFTSINMGVPTELIELLTADRRRPIVA